MFRGNTGFRRPSISIGAGGDFNAADFGSDFFLGDYPVFDGGSLLVGTDDGDSSNQFNYRIVLAPGAFASVVGATTCQLQFRFGTACASVTSAIASVYLGQAGSSAPNFSGDQVKVTFSNSSTINSSAAGVVLSDLITLARTFDITKSYVCSFFVGAAAVSLATTTGNSNVTLWTDHGAVGANQSALTVPTTASYSATTRLSFLAKIILQSS